MPSKYLVIQSCGAEDHPKYNGVSYVRPCESFEMVKEIVKQCASEYSQYIGHNLKPGDRLDENNLPTDGWPEHYYSENGLTLWVRGMSEAWERTEVFEWREDPGHYIHIP